MPGVSVVLPKILTGTPWQVIRPGSTTVSGSNTWISIDFEAGRWLIRSTIQGNSEVKNKYLEVQSDVYNLIGIVSKEP